jgi:hypothetical protein
MSAPQSPIVVFSNACPCCGHATLGGRGEYDALMIRKGPNKGEMVAKVSDDRKSELLQLGEERALIYKTAVLTWPT